MFAIFNAIALALARVSTLVVLELIVKGPRGELACELLGRLSVDTPLSIKGQQGKLIKGPQGKFIEGPQGTGLRTGGAPGRASPGS